MDRKIIRCILIRHGTTKGNTERRYVGAGTDEPLCEAGIRMLEQEREALAGLDLSGKLFTSPMKRARMTAEILFPGREATVIPQLHEMEFGEFEGKTADELESDARYRAWIEEGGTGAFPGGEDLAQFKARTVNAFTKTVLANADEEKLIFVFHGGNIMSLMWHFTERNYFEFIAENGEGYVLTLEVQGNEVHLVSFDRFPGRDNS